MPQKSTNRKKGFKIPDPYKNLKAAQKKATQKRTPAAPGKPSNINKPINPAKKTTTGNTAKKPATMRVDRFRGKFAKELIDRSDIKRRERSKHIRVYYKGVMRTKGWIHFIANSQYVIGKRYSVIVRLDDAKDLETFQGYKHKDLTRLLVAGKLSVYCSCPDFNYGGFQYMGWAQGYGIYVQRRFPHIRNPQLRGSVCKHTLAVMQVLGTNWMRIHSDMEKSSYWKQKYNKIKE